jgi:SOS-response transcriptional repressor LexA
MDENIFDRILMLMRKHGLNQSAFARKAGMSASFLTDIKKGTTNVSAGKIALIGNAFSVNEQWLLTGEGPMEVKITTSTATMTRNSRLPHEYGLMENTPSNVAPGPATLHRVPLISNVQAGAWTEIIDNLQPGDAEAWIDITSKVGPTAFALRVIGNSMEKEFWEGEMIIVDPAREPASGDYVVAKINHDEATFKQLLRDGGSIYLRPLNSAYPVIVVPPDKSFRIIGRVVEKVKRY